MDRKLSPYFEEKFSFIKNFSYFNKRWIASVAACLAGALVLVFYFQSGPRLETYREAERAFAKWKQAPQDEALYREMKEMLRKVPDLEKKYGAVVAQELFNEAKIEEALGFAHRALQQVQGEAPFHLAYGETTLLIEQGAYQQALEKAVALKEQMRNAFHWTQTSRESLPVGSLLYAHNLLRIACLHQHLQNKPGEKAAWEELEAFLQMKDPLSDLVYSNFREKGFNLAHYIAERKKQLSL